MSKERTYLLIVRGVISELDSADQAKVESAAQQIRQIVADHGEIGSVALALVTAEAANEA